MIRKVKLNWKAIKAVTVTLEEKHLGNRHTDVFQDELGMVKGFKVAVTIKSEHQPKFCQALAVPFVLRSKVEAELEHLKQLGGFLQCSSVNGPPQLCQ